MLSGLQGLADRLRSELGADCFQGQDARREREAVAVNEDHMGAHNAERPEAVFEDRVMLVEVYKSYVGGRSLYDAARYAWKAELRRAEKVDYVLAVRKGVGFVATKWLPATPANFPNFPALQRHHVSRRWGWPSRPDLMETFSIRYCVRMKTTSRIG
jgi:hypothetical protein